jgi:hypothetical protein
MPHSLQHLRPHFQDARSVSIVIAPVSIEAATSIAFSAERELMHWSSTYYTLVYEPEGDFSKNEFRRIESANDDASSPPIFRASTRLTQVDVVASDSSWRGEVEHLSRFECVSRVLR